jgi:hypothetical protein
MPGFPKAALSPAADTGPLRYSGTSTFFHMIYCSMCYLDEPRCLTCPRPFCRLGCHSSSAGCLPLSLAAIVAQLLAACPMDCSRHPVSRVTQRFWHERWSVQRGISGTTESIATDDLRAHAVVPPAHLSSAGKLLDVAICLSLLPLSVNELQATTTMQSAARTWQPLAE